MIIGSEIISIDNLTSTNSYAIHLLSHGKLPEGTIVQTYYQTAGRGQPGNKWESEEGKNLLISIILYPSTIHPEDQFIISMAISLGIHDYLSLQIPDSSIKWPNDIYIKNDKIAGILIESSLIGNRIEYLIAGIGLNVNQEKFTGNSPNPVSMKMITGTDYNTGDCLKELAYHLDKRYNQLLSGKTRRIKDEYISRLYHYHEWTTFRDPEGIFTGRIINVENNGRLIVEKKSGLSTEYLFKEVEFIL